MPFISGIFPAAASKTLQACAASPDLFVDPDSQSHAVDGALQTLCSVKRRLLFLIQTAAALRSVDVVWICNERRVGDGPTAVLQGCLLPAAVSHFLSSRTTTWTRWRRLIGLWSLSPGAYSLPDFLEILKTELCPCTPLHSDSISNCMLLFFWSFFLVVRCSSFESPFEKNLSAGNCKAISSMIHAIILLLVLQIFFFYPQNTQTGRSEIARCNLELHLICHCHKVHDMQAILEKK